VRSDEDEEGAGRRHKQIRRFKQRFRYQAREEHKMMRSWKGIRY